MADKNHLTSLQDTAVTLGYGMVLVRSVALIKSQEIQLWTFAPNRGLPYAAKVIRQEQITVLL